MESDFESDALTTRPRLHTGLSFFYEVNPVPGLWWALKCLWRLDLINYCHLLGKVKFLKYCSYQRFTPVSWGIDHLISVNYVSWASPFQQLPRVERFVNPVINSTGKWYALPASPFIPVADCDTVQMALLKGFSFAKKRERCQSANQSMIL